MDKIKLKQILKTRTAGIFTDEFYNELISEIMSKAVICKMPTFLDEDKDFITKHLSSLPINKKIYNHQVDDLIKEMNISKKKFIKYLKKYCEYIDATPIFRNSINGRYFVIWK